MRAIAMTTLLLLAAACAPRDAEIRRARLALEQRNLEASLDDLQARLLVNQARVRFWNEMRDRHESVSAIACTSQEAHAEDMAHHAVPPERGGRTRVAALPAAAVDEH
ncbi:MAG: hypothetical protein QM767_20710 [Anaeromyxobacter sp.]